MACDETCSSFTRKNAQLWNKLSRTKTIECLRLCILGSWREFENFMCEQLIYKFTKQPIHFVHDQQVPDVANVMFTMSYLLYIQCNGRCRLHEYSKYFHLFVE